MAFSTTAKVATGLGATATASAGAIWLYGTGKHKDGLFQIEREALKETSTWNVGQIANPNPGSKTISIPVSYVDSSNAARKWTCTIIATYTSNITDISKIKENLENYFGTLSDSAATSISATATKPTKEHKKGFVESCSKNKSILSNDEEVTSELHLSLDTSENKPQFKTGEDEGLEKIFSGTWTNKSVVLVAVEKYATEEGLIWAVKEETPPDLKTIVVSVSGSKDSSKANTHGVATTGSWTCKITTSASNIETLKTQLKTKFGISSNISATAADTTSSFTQENKKGFVGSCARNRIGTPTKDTVVSEIKLPKTSPEGKLEEVFNGTWVNPK